MSIDEAAFLRDQAQEKIAVILKELNEDTGLDIELVCRAYENKRNVQWIELKMSL